MHRVLFFSDPEDEKGEAQKRDWPKICRLVPRPVPEVVAFEVRRLHLHRRLVVTLFTPVEVAYSECEANNHCISPFHQNARQRGHNAGHDDGFQNMASPIPIALNGAPIDFDDTIRS